MTSKMLGMFVLTLAFIYLVMNDKQGIDYAAVALFAVYGTIMVIPKSWSDLLKSMVHFMNKDISLKDVYSDTRTKD